MAPYLKIIFGESDEDVLMMMCSKYATNIWSMFPIKKAWSSLVEGDEGLYWPNCHTNLVIVPRELPLMF